MAAGDAARRRVFRQLLRAASASVRFARPAARSVRKLVREDFEHATPALDVPQPTLTLFLLSALYERPIVQPAQRGAPVWRPDSDSDAARLAHRCVANLASLTYHHLSPNTAMQRKRAGGSSTSTAPRKQSVVNEAFAEMDAGTTDTAGGMHLHVLHVAPRPVRGPVGSKPMYWDAQHPEKHLANVEDHGEMERLERHVEELAEQHATLVAQLGAAHGAARLISRPALELLARKLTAVSGDVRRALDTCRQALDVVEAEGAACVQPSHVLRVLSHMAGHAQAARVRSLGIHAKLLLVAWVTLQERAEAQLSGQSPAVDGSVRIAELEAQNAKHEERVLKAYQKIKNDEKVKDKVRNP